MKLPEKQHSPPEYMLMFANVQKRCIVYVLFNKRARVFYQVQNETRTASLLNGFKRDFI
jgi:hypothetical protein